MKPLFNEKFKFLQSEGTKQSRDINGKVIRVPAKTDIITFLKDQPVEFQESVLGNQLAKVMRKGGLSNEKFKAMRLNSSFEPLSLIEMQKLEPLAFKNAGVLQ